jgi:hypothetical protein
MTSTKNDREIRCCIVCHADHVKLFKQIAALCLNKIEEFNFECEIYKYEHLSSSDIQKIRIQLKGNCILILECGEASLFHFYKLGLAHAHGNYAILLDVNLNLSKGDFKIPECIDNTFLISIRQEELSDRDKASQFIIKIRELIIQILQNNTFELLYQQACEIFDCEARITSSRSIAKVGKDEFLNRLNCESSDRYTDSPDELRQFLLKKIVANEEELLLLYLGQTASTPATSKNDESAPQSGPNFIFYTAHGASTVNNQPKTNNFNGPMSGVIASDGAQVSNNQFTQVNNANTAELLQLIATMRQTAAQFPQEIQDDLIIDIDDVEAEIQKPEAERNLTKLKKRLIALATAGTLIATPIAGMTDFAGKAIDLATKIGIELPMP